MKPKHKSVVLALLLANMGSTEASLAGEGYEVAAYYFPGYHAHPRNDERLGKGWTEWELLKAAKPRFANHAQPKVPAWGYLDESDPGVFEKKITAAADHGVTSFLFDWYWYDGPFLERALDEGFLKAKNRDRLKFALMWANHNWIDIFPARADTKPELLYPGGVDRKTFDQATDHIIQHYFSQPNYWKIDGKPYFSFYNLTMLIQGLGGVEKTRQALDGFRARTKMRGLPGLHVNAVAWSIKPDGFAKDADELLAVLGIDSVTSYCWAHHVRLSPFPAMPYETLAKQSADVWDRFRHRWKVPYHPNVSMGWDASPRTTQSGEFKPTGYPYTSVVVGNTPAAFKKSLVKVKTFLDAETDGPRILTINAWNEWTEGSYLEPDTVDGMGYLQALRDVFPPAK